jgi:predicted permease
VASGVIQDIRLALRTSAHSRLIFIPAVVTLALAIGANTTVFSLLNALLLRPLPVAQPDDLYWISSDYATSRGFSGGGGWSHAMWVALLERRAPFGGAFAWRPQRFVLGTGAATESVNGGYTSGEFYSTLGVSALHGRMFTTDDDRVGGGAAGPVAVISARLWQRRFGGRTDAIGDTLRVNGVPVTIVGVSPASFAGLDVGSPFDIALPMGIEPMVQGRTASLLNPRSYSLLVVVRLGDNQPLAAATSTLRGMQPDIVPASAPAFVSEPFTLVPMAGGAGPTSAAQIFGRPLVLLLSGVGLVLLIACVNLANLMLARGVARRHELSLRAALGASRWQLARTVLVESAVLTAVSTALALLIAPWGARGLVALTTTDLTPAVDWRVVVFTMGIAAAGLLLFAAAPVVRSMRRAPAETLTTAPRTGSLAQPFSAALMIGQVALAVMLVIVAGLFVRTFRELAGRPLGFDADRILLAQVDRSRAADSPDDREEAIRRLIAAAAATPGIESAAASAWTPLSGEGGGMSISTGATRADGEVDVLLNFVSPDWFAVYGVPMLAGRDVASHDTEASAGVVIVNEALANRLRLHGGDVIGRVIEGRQIVGIVGDAVYRTSERVPGMSSLAFREPMAPTLYAPLAQRPSWKWPASDLVRISARARDGDPVLLAPDVRAALSNVDARVAVELRPVMDDVRRSLAQERMSAAVALGFGVLATLLAAVGLYGVSSYAASQRVAELAIRTALGARPLDLIRLMLRRIVAIAAAGLAIGLTAASLLTSVLSTLLFGVSPRDPATFAGAAAILTAIVLLAALIPAVRASRIDPMTALRR